MRDWVATASDVRDGDFLIAQFQQKQQLPIARVRSEPAFRLKPLAREVSERYDADFAQNLRVDRFQLLYKPS